MKKRQRLALSIMAMTLLALGGCGPSGSPGETTGTGSAAASTSAIGTVEVTNYPLAYVVERLAGPLLEVRFRAAEAPDPAYWRPTAEQVIVMQEADLVVVNGAGYEGWLEDVSLPTSRLVDSTAQARDRLIAIVSTETHSHGLEGEHEHTGTAFTTWLDPTVLIAQARTVGEAFEREWPEHAALFADRLAALVADLEALDAELAVATASAADRPVIFSHPVYQYLERRYGLVGDSLHWEPDAAPDESRWAELERLLNHRRAAWMIWEAEPLAETAERLLGAGVRVVVVDPCSTPPVEGDFLDTIRHNAEALRAVYVAEQ